MSELTCHFCHKPLPYLGAPHSLYDCAEHLKERAEIAERQRDELTKALRSLANQLPDIVLDWMHDGLDNTNLGAIRAKRDNARGLLAGMAFAPLASLTIPTPPALPLDDDNLLDAPGEADEPCSDWGEED